jgi:PleD family two-component response regulator
MSGDRPVVVVADDVPASLSVLLHMLSEQNYEVLAAESGQAVLDLARDETPDLFLLDVLMPDLNGYEVCKRLKQDPRLGHIPVVFITAKSRSEDIVRGFEAGAADYVAKPFNKSEVLARVRTQLQLRATMQELERLRVFALDASPLTGLPGNKRIALAIAGAVESGLPQAVVYADLDNFKAYNDKYGFARGDEALKTTANVILSTIRDHCGAGNFVGHVGGDDFVLLLPSDRAPAVCEEIARAFDAAAPSLYDPEDAAAGCIRSVDREGKAHTFPLMTLSMGGVDLTHHEFRHYLEVADRCAEVKKAAKKLSGSSVYFDQRHV